MFLCLFALRAGAESIDAIDVSVRMQGEEVFVDVRFHVPVTPQEAWAVMTDYDHATEFISKLEKSVILSRTEAMLLVSQKGAMGFGPFFRADRNGDGSALTPYEKLQGRMISGNMKKNQSTTRLIADARHPSRVSPGVDSRCLDTAADRPRHSRIRNARALSPVGG